ALSGVLGVATHADAPDLNWHAPSSNYRGRILDGTARFVGDEIAAVAATSEAVAEAALALIEVEYEILPPVFDIEEAMKPDAPQVREEGNLRPPGIVSWGDPKQGEAEADLLVDCEVRFASQQFAPLGRNACIAEWNGDRVTLWTSSQTPSELRDGVHEAFGMPLSKIRVIALPTGSSFGQWWVNNFMLVTVLLAQKVRKPVKIELTPEECMATVKRRHIEIARGRMGCTKEGSLTLATFERTIDNGAYGFKGNAGISSADMWGRASHGHFALHGVNTNLLTAGCMRGVAEVTLGSCVERLADQLAEQVDMDPVEFRLKNQIRPGEELRRQAGRNCMKGSMEEYVGGIPADLRKDWPALFHLSSGSTEEILIEGAKAIGWKRKWKGWRRPYALDGPKRRAVGVGTGAHACGVESEGNTSALVHINADGSVKLFCSAGRQGQGSETTQAQVAAETLGVPFEAIEVEMGDTDSCPWSHGSIASNTLYRGGFATRSASLDAKRQVLEIAAREFFSVDPGELDIKEGLVQYRDDPEKNLTIGLREVLDELRSDTLGQTSSITGRPTEPMPPSTAFSRHFAAHFADVEVDTETGEIRLLDYVAAQDSGTVINPQVLKNQVVGGAICGAGFAIYEGLVFDEESGRIKNPNLVDYKLLRAADFPVQAKVIFGESYDPVGPFGARGAGEAPVAAAGPAISQAVYNAIGVWVDMPMTPERVVRALGQLS
ncbi:MAG: xanthine dehydrogenase family protein molybdopterin-binding subunit, partial [bacterium]|nr:xanthine dehydrogenase family protein molybdopterin-binding subunit [bacterium]